MLNQDNMMATLMTWDIYLPLIVIRWCRQTRSPYHEAKYQSLILFL